MAYIYTRHPLTPGPVAPFTSCSHPAVAKCLLTYTASSVLPQALESSAQQNTSLFPGKHTGDTNGGGCWSLFLAEGAVVGATLELEGHNTSHSPSK